LAKKNQAVAAAEFSLTNAAAVVYVLTMDYDGRFDRILQQAELVAGWRCPQLVMFKVWIIF
jgi:hypothetical protein